jgi:hypothetical protein
LTSPSAAVPSKLMMVMQNPPPTTTASNHWTHFVLLQLFTCNQAAGAEETTSSGCIELLRSFLCFRLASYFFRLCT